MEVECTINIDDVLAYYLYYRVNSTKAKRSLKTQSIVSLVLGVLGGVYVVFVWPDKMLAIPVFLFSICAIYNGIFTKTSARKLIIKGVNWRYGKGKNDIIGNHKFTITEDQITDKNEKRVSTERWGLIEEILITEQYIFLNMRASMGFYIIPKREFSSDADFNNFAEKAKEFHRAAIIKRNAL